MKIIMGNKENKKEDKQKVFTCQNCGCVYSANEDEYHAEMNLNGMGDYSETVYANCPECYRMNRAKMNRAKDSPTSITLTTEPHLNYCCTHDVPVETLKLEELNAR